MAPHLQLAKRADAFTSQSLQAREDPTFLSSPWIIVAIILGVMIVVTVAIFGLLYVKKRQRKARETRQRQLPGISMRHDAVQRRMRNMSDEQRQEAHELERSFMIRKSLASRSTFSTIASRDSHVMHSTRSSRLTVNDISQDPAQGDEWKAWESDVLQERRHSRLQELVSGRQEHPALARELTDLPIPRKARTSSPATEAIVPRHMMPLPALPSPLPSCAYI